MRLLSIPKECWRIFNASAPLRRIALATEGSSNQQDRATLHLLDDSWQKWETENEQGISPHHTDQKSAGAIYEFMKGCNKFSGKLLKHDSYMQRCPKAAGFEPESSCLHFPVRITEHRGALEHAEIAEQFQIHKNTKDMKQMYLNIYLFQWLTHMSEWWWPILTRYWHETVSRAYETCLLLGFL